MNEDPDCKFFQTLAEQGHYQGGREKSKQGTYICSADGTLLGSINSTNPNDVLKLMKQGFEKFNTLAPENKNKFDQAKLKSTFRWETSFPREGLVLAVYSRDLPETFEVASNPTVKWNRDTAWFTRSEMLEPIPAAPKAGHTFSLPVTLVQRLARFHFVDNVRGQTDPFEGAETNGSEIRCTVSKVTDDRIEFEIKGQIKANSTSEKYNRTPRGVVTTLLGSATFLTTEERFEKFDMVAVGYRWGRTRFNGRKRGPNSNPVGFAVSLAPIDESPNVPGLIYAYDVDWIKRN